jgi:hypothetical protein
MVPKLKDIVTLYRGITLRYLVSLVTRSWDDVRLRRPLPTTRYKFEIPLACQTPFPAWGLAYALVCLVAISITSRKKRPQARNGATVLLEQRIGAASICPLTIGGGLKL